MATTLGSPGVLVSVVDESFYTPAAPGTVPVIFVATAQDKKNSSGTGTAQGTTAANAGKVWLVTSQRDLSDTFGTPLFYTDTNNNPIHGGELNEYGLQAAYSLLGVSSRAYVVRANVDLGSLKASTSIPKGAPNSGTYWIDTAASLFGINEWNAAGRGSFTVKTPLIIDDSNVSTASTNGTPKDNFGKPGDYAVYVTSDNGAAYPNSVWYKTTATSSAWVLVETGFNGGKAVAISPHTQYPSFNNATPTGSVWIKTTSPGYGSNWVVKYYSGTTKTWSIVSAPVYSSTVQAIQKLDPNGGAAIPVGTVFVESDPGHYAMSGTPVAEFLLWRKNSTGATSITSNASATTNASSGQFTIRETLANNYAWSNNIAINVPGSGSSPVGAQIAAAINTSSLVNVSASFDTATNRLTITHRLGGAFELKNGANNPLTAAGLALGLANLYAAPANDAFDFLVSSWKPLSYVAEPSAPYTLPANGTLWYDANLSTVDIMINDGNKWVGYKHYPSFYQNPLVNGINATDPLGPTVGATQPTTQQDGVTDLVDGDIWVDTSDIDMYGKNVYVYDGQALKWIQQDVSDHSSPSGWVFHDARWSDNGIDNPEYITPVADLLVSNYVDPDVVDPALYPKGTRLWNLRRSGFNVKKFEAGYIDVNANNGLNIMYQNDSMSGYSPDRWVSISPNDANGVGAFGRLAQRAVGVAAMKAEMDTNLVIRDTDTVVFNLIAAPGYPELIANMVNLNVDRGLTALVVGDTPFRLTPTATSLTDWGMNSNSALDNGDDGLVTHDSYTAVYYPSGYTTDNTGNKIVVPPSHMMLRTILNSDNKSYPWFAPAGTNRGTIDNATSVGYIDSSTGEFKTASLYQGLRDVMHTIEVNPIATLPGIGLVAYGQYTLSPVASALDRINVARLVAFLRTRLQTAVKPYLFEPNDSQTRNEVKKAVESILIELVGQRALNDFVVVCDTSNNTPARIDRSELWIDVAIEPIKAVEFIYIPLRLLNTGAIASGNLGAGFPGTGAA